MRFTAEFLNRDFSSPILTHLKTTPIKFSWSAFGGPEKATVRLDGDPDDLLAMTRLLRCPVTFSDLETTPVWWGYVFDITIFFQGVRIKVSLDNLFNSVVVSFSFISPDNKLADQYSTSPAEDDLSQAEFGVREIVLKRFNIDDDFADNLRDTFLSLYSWPSSLLSPSTVASPSFALVTCKGWFETLAWKHYTNYHGFYANYGPGPGIFPFHYAGTAIGPSQRITPGANVSLKYAYFRLRRVGAPGGTIIARIRNSAGGTLADSIAIGGNSLDTVSFLWVKFTFATAYALIAGSTYLIGVTSANAVSGGNYFMIKTDEDLNYEGGYGVYWNSSSWVSLPSITRPGLGADLMFRAVCISDTGDQLNDIANAGSQFFDRITSLTTGVLASPYRDNGFDCLRELDNIMLNGTSNQRLILAMVSPERHLSFYEQPDRNTPTVFLDSQKNFYTLQGKKIPPYFPPVGQFAAFSGTTRITSPWDKDRVPAGFVESAAYFPPTGRLKIKTG